MGVVEVDRDAIASAFLGCADVSLRLADRQEVRAAWESESACAGMTVGGLTHHLLGQVRNTARLMRQAAPAGAATIGLLEHYAQAPWVAASRQGEVDPEQLASDNEGAQAGPDAVLIAGREARTEVPALLAEPRDPDTVFIAWQGWSLTTTDFLTTRMMEMVVHADDLAASVNLVVGTDVPSFDETAVDLVVALLAAVSVRRHGPTPVLRALSRPQRAVGDVSAF